MQRFIPYSALSICCLLLTCYSNRQFSLPISNEVGTKPEFTDKQCTCILYFAHESSIASKFQEPGHKIVTRWYRVTAKLHRITLHIFWTCLRVRPFWLEVCKLIHNPIGLSYWPTWQIIQQLAFCILVLYPRENTYAH